MMLHTKTIGYYFRYPLMAVMLLWALTLPGYEVEVYNFLLHGTSAKSTFRLAPAPGNEGQVAVQQQAVEVFEDAKEASYLKVDLQQLAKHPLLAFIFAAPADGPLLACTANAAGARLLARRFLFPIQPNAP